MRAARSLALVWLGPSGAPAFYRPLLIMRRPQDAAENPQPEKVPEDFHQSLWLTCAWNRRKSRSRSSRDRAFTAGWGLCGATELEKDVSRGPFEAGS